MLKFVFLIFFISISCWSNNLGPNAYKKPTIYFFPQIHNADDVDDVKWKKISKLQQLLYTCLKDFSENKNVFIIAEGRSPSTLIKKTSSKKPDKNSIVLANMIANYTAAHVLLTYDDVKGMPEYKTDFFNKLNQQADKVIDRHREELSSLSKIAQVDLLKKNHARVFVIGGGCDSKNIKCSQALAIDSNKVRQMRLDNLLSNIKANKFKTIGVVFGGYHYEEFKKEMSIQIYDKGKNCNSYLEYYSDLNQGSK